MYMIFKSTLRELLKFVPVGIPEFSSKSGKRPLIYTQTRKFNIKVARRGAPGLVRMYFINFSKEITDIRQNRQT